SGISAAYEVSLIHLKKSDDAAEGCVYVAVTQLELGLSDAGVARRNFCLRALDRVLHCGFEVSQICLARINCRTRGFLRRHCSVKILFGYSFFFSERR